LSEGGVFVDVGANIGLMSLFASREVGDEGAVFSFEPNPSVFSILQQNAGLNGWRCIKSKDRSVAKSSKG
jgi:FkbM family methyltransferase